MVTVSIPEARKQLSRLIDRALAGERVAIGRPGEPLVELVRISRPKVRLGIAAGQVVIDDAAFVAADAEVRRLWNRELHIDD